MLLTPCSCRTRPLFLGVTAKVLHCEALCTVTEPSHAQHTDTCTWTRTHTEGSTQALTGHCVLHSVWSTEKTDVLYCSVFSAGKKFQNKDLRILVFKSLCQNEEMEIHLPIYLIFLSKLAQYMAHCGDSLPKSCISMSSSHQLASLWSKQEQKPTHLSNNAAGLWA